jgi:PAS domain S-box-containing protein
LTGNAFRLREKIWQKFVNYEEELDKTVIRLRMKAMCTYPLELYRTEQVMEVLNNHGATLIKRKTWRLIGKAERSRPAEAARNKKSGGFEEELQLRAAVLRDQNAKLRSDIVKRARDQHALSKQAEILQKIFDHIPVMINFVDQNGRIQLVNQAWQRTLGWTLREVKAENLDIFAACYPDPKVRREVLDFVAQSNGEWKDFKPRTKSGLEIETQWAIVHLADGTRIGIGQDTTARKATEMQLRNSRERLRALTKYLQSVREDERTRMARELHDEVGQALTGIKLALERTVREGSGRGPAALAQPLRLVNDLIGTARDLSLELRPAMLDDLGLLAALRWHFQHYTAQCDIAVNFKYTGIENRRFPPDTETAAYRIIQEALTNVAHHAGVDRVAVKIDADEKRLRIEIRDRGVGFEPQTLPPARTGGLAGMRQRATMIGGQFSLESMPGRGSSIEVELPVRPGVSANSQ